MVLKLSYVSYASSVTLFNCLAKTIYKGTFDYNRPYAGIIFCPFNISNQRPATALKVGWIFSDFQGLNFSTFC